MNEEGTEFAMLIVNLFGLLVATMALTAGLIYFVVTVAFIIVMNGLLITGHIVSSRSETQETSVNPVNALQERFANGELTEEEFERKLDQIVKSQDLADQVDDENLDILRDT